MIDNGEKLLYNGMVVEKIMIDVRKIQLNESTTVDIWVDVVMPQEFSAADTSAHVMGKLTNTGKSFVFEGQASCRLSLACSLCLMSAEQDLSFRINENFVEAEAATGEDIGFSDKTIDIFPAVQRNLFLNIPMKPMCSVDCAGLCPRCGKNLNEGECDCKGEINEQFRELLGLFND
ncbi:MAG: DUF177 domain-containing protein [Defluviitaleaceae bacterium]|nr:DUF177 domain-containing protein [Defluviitaleaceae bacterium]